MGHLHRGLPVELGILREHSSEHGNVHGAVCGAQNELLDVVRLLLSGEHPVGPFERRRPLVRRDERELANPDVGRVLLDCGFVHLAEDVRDVPCNCTGLLFVDALAQQMAANFVADALGPFPHVPLQTISHRIRGSGSALEGLGREAQTRDTAVDCRLRPAQVVAVRIGRRIHRQEMKLHESGHSSALL